MLQLVHSMRVESISRFDVAERLPVLSQFHKRQDAVLDKVHEQVHMWSLARTALPTWMAVCCVEMCALDLCISLNSQHGTACDKQGLHIFALCKTRTHVALFKSATGAYVCEIQVKHEKEAVDLMGLGFDSLDDLEQAVSASTHTYSDCASDDEYYRSASQDGMPAQQEPGD